MGKPDRQLVPGSRDDQLTLMNAACISSLSNRSAVSFLFNLNPTCMSVLMVSEKEVTYLKLSVTGPITITRMERLAFHGLSHC